MNAFELILFAGFVETVILFLYAVRWYLFSFAALRGGRVGGSGKLDWRRAGDCFVSVLLPIYNEPNVVDRLLGACTSFGSPPYEVVVVDDSDDGVTTERLRAWERRVGHVKVVHREGRRGWKGGALNVGLDNLDPRSSHVLVFDADFVPSSDLVSRFVAKFSEVDGKGGVVAVQGYQRHDLNGDENWITKGVRVWHSVYNMVELNGQRRLGLFSLLTGGVYIIRTDVLKRFRFGEVTTEDTELTARLHEAGCKVVYDPELAASGECPNTLRRLFGQQMRWAEGHTRIFRDHFLKILRSRFVSLRDKVNFMFFGFSFLNSVLLACLMVVWLMTFLFPAYFPPQPMMQAGLVLFLASVPCGVFSSFVALKVEGARKDFGKIPFAWALNFFMIPFIAYAAVKGLVTRNGYFSRTYKTGKISVKSDLRLRSTSPVGLRHITKASGSVRPSVLMVSTFPPDRDGIASYASRLVNALRKENVVTKNAANGREWKRNSPVYIFSIMRKAVASKSRIVHVQLSYFTFGNEYYTGLFPLLSLCLKLMGKRVVITIHDIVPRSNITNDFIKNYTSARLLGFKRWALFHYTRFVCLIADRLIIHSEIARDVLTQDYAVSQEKIGIIPHGIDDLSFPIDEDHGKPKFLTSEGCRLVSYFGLVRRGKGLEDLVRAWKKTGNMNAQLLIIGGRHPVLRDNCYEDLTMLIKELGLETSIRFCGYVPTESLSTYFAESDAFIFPYNEWGDVIASSGALSMVAPYRKPIIATDVPAFDDLKRSGAAIIVRRGDINGLASAITEALTDPRTRNSLVVKLNEWLSEMGWSKVAEKTATVYRELI